MCVVLQIDPKKFYRISRKFLVHINAASDIISYGTSHLKLRLKAIDSYEEIIVNRDRVKAFKLCLGKEIQKQHYFFHHLF